MVPASCNLSFSIQALGLMGCPPQLIMYAKLLYGYWGSTALGIALVLETFCCLYRWGLCWNVFLNLALGCLNILKHHFFLTFPSFYSFIYVFSCLLLVCVALSLLVVINDTFMLSYTELSMKMASQVKMWNSTSLWFIVTLSSPWQPLSVPWTLLVSNMVTKKEG